MEVVFTRVAYVQGEKAELPDGDILWGLNHTGLRLFYKLCGICGIGRVMVCVASWDGDTMCSCSVQTLSLLLDY